MAVDRWEDGGESWYAEYKRRRTRNAAVLQARAQLEVLRREKNARLLIRNALIEGLFGQQKAFVTSPERLKVAVTTRRAGKTHGEMVELVCAAIEKPRTDSVFIATTRQQAKRLIWRSLKFLNEQYQIGIVFHETELRAIFPNESEIHVRGCPDRSSIDVFRGNAYAKATIDEAGTYGEYLQELIFDVLQPALMDHRGSLSLTGTPSVLPQGLFYDISEGGGELKRWPCWHWSMVDNPHLDDPTSERKRVMEAQGWTEDHPTYQREWLGLWVPDYGQMVYALPPHAIQTDLNVSRDEGWRFVLGVDLGASAKVESTAFSIVAYHPTKPRAVVWEVTTDADMIPDTIAARIKRLDQRYNFERIVMDAGALGRGYIGEMQRKHSLFVADAQKKDKLAYIENLNGDMKIGTLVLNKHGCEQLIDQMRHHEWDRRAGIREKDGSPNHACDATLYAYRECRHFDAKPPAEVKGYVETQEERIERDLKARHTKELEPEWKKPNKQRQRVVRTRRGRRVKQSLSGI